MEELLVSKSGPEQQQKMNHFKSHLTKNSLQMKKAHEMGISCKTFFMIDTFNDDRNIEGLIHGSHIVFAVQGMPLVCNKEKDCFFFVDAFFFASV